MLINFTFSEVENNAYCLKIHCLMQSVRHTNESQEEMNAWKGKEISYPAGCTEHGEETGGGGLGITTAMGVTPSPYV